jgi:glycosyltransferase involved in cell wall biosynthesis
VVSHDVVGKQMAGPGIRYYHLARVLSQEFDVRLAAPDEVTASVREQGFRVVQYARREWASIEPWVNWAEIVVFPSDIASDFPQIGEADAFLVVDGYDPLLAEWLALNPSQTPQEQDVQWRQRMRDLGQQYLMGDFFLCASERQRDWRLGALEVNGRINPYTFGDDPSLRRLIDVVPFGLPKERPLSSESVLRGIWPAIAPGDKVVLWGGGLWPWLDPLTAIRAMARVWEQRQDVRLIFPGTKHPNPWMEGIPTHNEAARQTARRLGLVNRGVFFGEWIPYEEWANVLVESDVALALHYDTLETRLAFRSRMLDYIWAGLPVVTTRGDATSDLVEAYNLGAVVDFEDVDGVAEAILRLSELPRDALREQFAEARETLTWEHTAQPLVAFCRHPRRAPDKIAMEDGLGNPFYVEERKRLVEERDRWRQLVRKYEAGRFIRAMRWLDRVARRLRST